MIIIYRPTLKETNTQVSGFTTETDAQGWIEEHVPRNRDEWEVRTENVFTNLAEYEDHIGYYDRAVELRKAGK